MCRLKVHHNDACKVDSHIQLLIWRPLIHVAQFMAGDWVKGVPHGANGLSQERAYVTGEQDLCLAPSVSCVWLHLLAVFVLWIEMR